MARRKGGMRRVDHDISAKAKSVKEAENLRAALEDASVLACATNLLLVIEAKGFNLSDELVLHVAHNAIRQAQKSRGRTQVTETNSK